MRSSAASLPDNELQVLEARRLLPELRDTAESLQRYLAELESVLAKPSFDAAALTSVRLKLAGLRLTRGPLVVRVHDLLSGNVGEREDRLLAELRDSHLRLLKAATAHTARWSLAAIEEDWEEYRAQTRNLMRSWITKANHEQRLIIPLVQMIARQG